MIYEHIIYDQKDKIGIIILNRPKKRNAVSPAMAAEVEDVLDKATGDDNLVALIITGGKDFFCAGLDLTTQRPKGMKGSDIVTMIETVYRYEKPTIAAVSGFAFGGGLELALACDLRACSTSALFGLPEIKLGVLAVGGGTQRLPRTIGLTWAKEMIFTGDPIGAEDAYRLGLVNRVVPVETFLDEAKKIAGVIAKRPPLALKGAKKAVNLGNEMDIKAALQVDHSIDEVLVASEDAKEGISAFLEKRKPVWKGK